MSAIPCVWTCACMHVPKEEVWSVKEKESWQDLFIAAHCWQFSVDLGWGFCTLIPLCRSPELELAQILTPDSTSLLRCPAKHC